MFEFAPVSDRIARIREKRDAFTEGSLSPSTRNARRSIRITSKRIQASTRSSGGPVRCWNGLQKKWSTSSKTTFSSARPVPTSGA